MSYELSYFAYSLIFLSIWLLLFSLRKDLRRRMVIFSVVVAPMGPVSEIWFLRDYWQRPTVTSYPISIEDALFAFAVGGIAFSIYKVVFNVAPVASESQRPRAWLPVAFTLIVLSFMLFFTDWLGVNSIFSSSLAFVAVALIAYRLRPDLIKPSICTGLLTLAVFLIVYQIMRLVFSDVLLKWCVGCNPTGVRIFGVNVEELLWDFTWGLTGAVLYEATRGKTLEKRKKTTTATGLCVL